MDVINFLLLLVCYALPCPGSIMGTISGLEYAERCCLVSERSVNHTVLMFAEQKKIREQGFTRR